MYTTTTTTRRFVLTALVAAATTGLALPSRAGDTASRDEAVAMVKKTIAYYKANGNDKTMADINAKLPQFSDRDLYIYVATLDGVATAHAANAKIVGKNMSQLKDAEGVPFVEEILKQSKAGKSGWVDYKWPHPVSKVVEAKTTYFETFDNHVFLAGVYR